MREMEVLGVRIEMPHTAPMVLLRESDGGRYLPIWIGAAEAAAIANCLEGVRSPRPLTHDLMMDILGQMEQPLRAVHITELADGTFFARVLVGEREIEARPSDAIALAVRAQAPVLCADDVLDVAGVELVGDDCIEVEEKQVEEFRAFLDSVDAEDFKP